MAMNPPLTLASAATLRLHRDAFGALVLTLADGTVHAGVVPVRAFPIATPEGAISLVGADGHEVAWIDRLTDLADDARALLVDELSRREFIPELRRIVRVSTYSTPSIWDVETDRGPTQLTLKGEEDIRRITRNTLLIADGHGLNYLIRDLGAMDRGTRRILDRFL
jgi:Domain of unknown function (DUF1854)